MSAHCLSAANARFLTFVYPSKDIPLCFDNCVLMTSTLRVSYQLHPKVCDEVDDKAVALLVQVLGTNVRELLICWLVVDGDLPFLD